MMKCSRLAVVLTIILMCLRGAVYASGTVLELKIGSGKAILNGEVVLMDPEVRSTELTVAHGRTLVPIRFLAETYGYAVSWIDKTKTVTLKRDKTQISLMLDSNVMSVNRDGNTNYMVHLDISPRSINGRIYIPLTKEVMADAFRQSFFMQIDQYYYIGSEIHPDLSPEYANSRALLFQSEYSEKTYPRITYADIKPDFLTDLAAAKLSVSAASTVKLASQQKKETALKSLASGQTDIVICTQLTNSDLKSLRDQNVNVETFLFSRDAVVFMVNSNNQLTGITVDNARDVYSGKITNFSLIGGQRINISAFQWRRTDIDHLFMESVVMNGTRVKTASSDMMLSSSFTLSARSSYANSFFGYALYSTDIQKNDNIKLLQVDGVSPNRINITSTKYPLTIDYYAVIRADVAQDSPTRRLVGYLLGNDGQILVESTGLVPIK